MCARSSSSRTKPHRCATRIEAALSGAHVSSSRSVPAVAEAGDGARERLPLGAAVAGGSRLRHLASPRPARGYQRTDRGKLFVRGDSCGLPARRLERHPEGKLLYGSSGFKQIGEGIA
jgi:hypothetical protein